MNTIVPCACPANKDGRKCDNLHKIILEMAQKYPENSNFSNLVGQVKLMTHYYKDDCRDFGSLRWTTSTATAS